MSEHQDFIQIIEVYMEEIIEPLINQEINRLNQEINVLKNYLTMFVQNELSKKANKSEVELGHQSVVYHANDNYQKSLYHTNDLVSKLESKLIALSNIIDNHGILSTRILDNNYDYSRNFTNEMTRIRNITGGMLAGAGSGTGSQRKRK